MKIEASQLLTICPACKPDVADGLAQCLPGVLEKYAIDTPLRVAHFLAQTGHESAGFREFVENLNYSASGLQGTFPKYFHQVSTAAYAHNPEKIANHVYADRMGNGNEASGDGWKFRGRGMIQLTGRENYTAFSKHSGKDAIQDPDFLSTPEGAAESAAWYWLERNINKPADADDVVEVTKLINGGTLGLDERKALLVKAKEVVKQMFG
ncbi:MAG: glycoside hydrolase family 19 protein [Proteobacteria bacterium]|nr:glycoside hydrolase family 19 protein [Pseudomonadota bacterium]